MKAFVLILPVLAAALAAWGWWRIKPVDDALDEHWRNLKLHSREAF